MWLCPSFHFVGLCPVVFCTVGFCTVGLCPGRFCTVGLCPVEFCPGFRLALPDYLDHILNHLDTSFSNDLGVGSSLCHDSNWSGRGIPSLTIKDCIRLRKSLTGHHLSAEKRFCNCYSKISIKGMPIDNKEEVYQQVHSTYYIEPLEPLAFPLQYLYMKSTALFRRTISWILHQCHPSNIESLIWYFQSLCMPQRRQYLSFSSLADKPIKYSKLFINTLKPTITINLCRSTTFHTF